jgi:hypothetical protein
MPVRPSLPRRPTALALAATGLSLVVAVPVAVGTGTLPALASESAPPDPATPAAWSMAAEQAADRARMPDRSQSAGAQRTADAVRLAGQRQLTSRVVVTAAAEQAEAERREAERIAAEQAEAARLQAEAERLAAERLAAEQLAARAAEAERASRAQRSADPRGLARALLAERGQGGEQFSCLDRLWTKESEWRTTAANPTSSAYGIPQALPGSKMASAGADWRTNPATQIRWGLGYIADRYGSPCAAWRHSQAHNWY